MKRLLIVTPTFPPHPSPATHRSRFLARWGEAFGWDVELATVKPSCYEEAPDDELARLVPDGLRVARAEAYPARVTRRVGVGDIALRSYFPLRQLVRRLCAQQKPDLLFFPGPPFYTFLIGADAHARFATPFVLDYTDPWIDPWRPGLGNPLRKVFWSRRLATGLEPRAVKRAAKLFAVSDATLAGVRERMPALPDSRFVTEPIGFEPADFDAVRERGAPQGFWSANDRCVHLLYAGAVSSTMTPVVAALMTALARVRDGSPDLYRRLRVHFVGTSYDPRVAEGPVAPLARAAGVHDVVHEHPRRVAYVDALRLLTAADVILGIGSTDRHYQASKIFNCIAARRPMLAMYHHASAVCDTMRETGAGSLLTYGDAGPDQRVISELSASLKAIAAGLLPPAPSRLGPLEHHTARAMAGRMFAEFDAVTGGARQIEVAHA